MHKTHHQLKIWSSSNTNVKEYPLKQIREPTRLLVWGFVRSLDEFKNERFNYGNINTIICKYMTGERIEWNLAKNPFVMTAAATNSPCTPLCCLYFDYKSLMDNNCNIQMHTQLLCKHNNDFQSTIRVGVIGIPSELFDEQLYGSGQCVYDILCEEGLTTVKRIAKLKEIADGGHDVRSIELGFDAFTNPWSVTRLCTVIENGHEDDSEPFDDYKDNYNGRKRLDKYKNKFYNPQSDRLDLRDFTHEEFKIVYKNQNYFRHFDIPGFDGGIHLNRNPDIKHKYFLCITTNVCCTKQNCPNTISFDLPFIKLPIDIENKKEVKPVKHLKIKNKKQQQAQVGYTSDVIDAILKRTKIPKANKMIERVRKRMQMVIEHCLKESKINDYAREQLIIKFELDQQATDTQIAAEFGYAIKRELQIVQVSPESLSDHFNNHQFACGNTSFELIFSQIITDKDCEIVYNLLQPLGGGTLKLNIVGECCVLKQNAHIIKSLRSSRSKNVDHDGPSNKRLEMSSDTSEDWFGLDMDIV